MIKLKKILKEAICKDLYSDSLPNSRAKEFQGALTRLEKYRFYERCYKIQKRWSSR